MHLQEMVGAAGPLRTGDEVDFLLPPPPPGGKPQKSTAGNPSGGRRAVGTVRVQVGAAATLFFHVVTRRHVITLL